jgi:hypothetical protein
MARPPDERTNAAATTTAAPTTTDRAVTRAVFDVVVLAVSVSVLLLVLLRVRRMRRIAHCAIDCCDFMTARARTALLGKLFVSGRDR